MVFRIILTGIVEELFYTFMDVILWVFIFIVANGASFRRRISDILVTGCNCVDL